MGLTTSPCKKSTVTKTRAKAKIKQSLGEEEAPGSTPGSMKASGESRKKATSRRTSSSSKNSLRIASWNVRTLYETGKCQQAVMEMQRYKLDILGVSETHWTQLGQKKLQSGEVILFSGRDQAPHREGVALILGKKANKTLRGWEAHGPRIIMASFSTKKKRINNNIVQSYAPTNDTADEEKQQF